MRVGEVLKLTQMDIEDHKAIIPDPKSGREAEVAFLPQKVADRLKKYVRDTGIKQDARIFPINLCCCVIRTSQVHRYIWEKSAMLKPYGGLTTSMGNFDGGRVGLSGFGPAISRKVFSDQSRIVLVFLRKPTCENFSFG